MGGERALEDSETPQARVAQLFMEHKGLGSVQPYTFEKVEGEPTWYYYYDLPEGKLELEVAWDGGAWDTVVTSFTLSD